MALDTPHLYVFHQLQILCESWMNTRLISFFGRSSTPVDTFRPSQVSSGIQYYGMPDEACDGRNAALNWEEFIGVHDCPRRISLLFNTACLTIFTTGWTPYYWRIFRRSINIFLAQRANNWFPWTRLFMACHPFIHNHGSTPIRACSQCFRTSFPVSLEGRMTIEKKHYSMHDAAVLLITITSTRHILYQLHHWKHEWPNELTLLWSKRNLTAKLFDQPLQW